jgi:hypothetical protein
MEETISNFADSLQGRLAVSLRRPNPIILLPNERDAPGIVAVGLSGFHASLNALTFRFLVGSQRGAGAEPLL